MFILLLAVSILCLGSWANLLRLTGPGWRFELWSIDFALGAVLTSCLIAFSFGSFGSELSVTDRLAVAGLRSQAYVLAAGFWFSIGTMLLIGTVSLLGIGRAFAFVSSVAWAVALLSGWAQGGHEQPLWSVLLAVLALATSVEGIRRSAEMRRYRPTGKPVMSRGTKSVVTGLLAGIFVGAAYVLAGWGLWGELGLHSDAGLLLFSLGLFLSALPFSVYLMNVAIEGGRLPLKAYKIGTRRQHGLGLAAGFLWSIGMFTAFLAKDLHDGGSENNQNFLPLISILLPALLATAWGWSWKDERPALRKTLGWWVGVLCCLTGAAIVALRQSSR